MYGIVVAVAVAIFAMAFIFGSSFVGQPNAQAEGLIEHPVDNVVTISHKADTPESYLADGGRAAVVMELPTKHVIISKGEDATAPVVLRHLSGSNNPSSFVDVKLSPPNGYIYYSASLAKSTTEEQRMEAAMTGNLITGSIDLGTFVEFDDASANPKIDADATSIVQARFVVPANIPDEMIGQTIQLPIILSAFDDKGDEVFTQNDLLEVEIVG
jgi:hypothetical protein